MRRALSIAAAVLCVSAALTGCSFVKAVKIGEEGKYTGAKTFNASDESSADWTNIVADIKKQAEKNDLASLLEDGGLKKPEAVTLKGKVVSFESMANGKKTYLVVVPDGYKGKTEVDVQTGSIYTGTAVRDVQNEKKFEDFTNQTEWSEYAKSLNAEVDSNVIAALDFAKNDPTGKTVTLTGAAESTAGKVVVTPVEMTVE